MNKRPRSVAPFCFIKITARSQCSELVHNAQVAARSNARHHVQALKCLATGVTGIGAHSAASASLQHLQFDCNGALPPHSLAHLRSFASLRSLTLVDTFAATPDSDDCTHLRGDQTVLCHASAPGQMVKQRRSGMLAGPADASEAACDDVWGALAGAVASALPKLQRAALARQDTFGECLAHALAQRDNDAEHCSVSLC